MTINNPCCHLLSSFYQSLHWCNIDSSEVRLIQGDQNKGENKNINMTKPPKQKTRCCVKFQAAYFQL